MKIHRKVHRFLLLLAALFVRISTIYAEPLFILPLDEGTLTKRPDGTAQRDFTLSAQMSNAREDARFTTMYYQTPRANNAQYVLGPVLKMNRGDFVQAKIQNALPVATSVHWHGIEDIPSSSDGVFYPIAKRGAKQDSTEIAFAVDQPGGLSWFHPHLHKSTAEQVYRGLIGVSLVEDPQNPTEMALPRSYGVDDFVLVLTDKEVTRRGEIEYSPTAMDYMMRGYIGNYVMTNWQFAPSQSVGRGFVRFRFLNASTSKEVRIRTDKNIPMYRIASGGGILDAPQKTQSIFLVAGNRAEVLIDTKNFREDSFSFVSSPVARMHNRSGAQPILTVAITAQNARVQTLPKSRMLQNADAPALPKTFSAKRAFVFAGRSMMSRSSAPFTINGKEFSKDLIDTVSQAGTWEEWTISSKRGMHGFDHSFHVHATSFIVTSVNGKTPNADYAGWQDTIYIRPADVIKIAIPITSSKGLYVYHCHILEHEDVGMMGTLDVR